MLSTTSGMLGAVVSRSAARKEVCDRATTEVQGRASLHSCFLPPWIPMRTTFSFPSSNSPVHGRSGDATSRRAFKSQSSASNVDLKGNFGSLSIGAEMKTSPPRWQIGVSPASDRCEAPVEVDLG